MASKRKEVLLYDEISEYGVSAKAFLAEVKAAGDRLTVRINSPGGDVFEAVAMHSALMLAGDVEVYVDGLAASAASLVAMAAPRRVMMPGSMMMIHEPWAITIGTADDLRKEANTLDQLREEALTIYSQASGVHRETLSPLMRAESWFRPDEALAIGLATEVDGGDSSFMQANAPQRYRMRWRNAPQSWLREQERLSGLEQVRLRRKIERMQRATKGPTS